ncbi:SDR family oxidoreductase [Streptomyces nitrosporeus]|uniref:SDR family oxidoreductase n=1 Tax=Streptomyces nitrosporeus TaxID=28894 RepID=A0A5J6F4X6_9ACTN|nr:SDR family oxidoreductase [Streptomyces nitrosporeus]QEU71066.1 SDR family oxidoreductase [Streptomyces nitrosporeus]GGZ14808.1 oxidoreductase [Streptomyces nitrosporeus]
MPRNVVVTGSGSGIGAALTTLLRAQGDRVIGVDLKGGDIDADLSTPAGRAAAATAASEAAGGVVDAAVTCAGTSVPGTAMVTVNYFGTTEFLTALRPALAAAGQPRVVAVGSVSGTQPADPDVVTACLAGDEAEALRHAGRAVADGHARRLYPSSKAALARWARRTAVAPGWADAGIPVNVVAPGIVLTPMTAGLFDDPGMKKVMDTAVPMPLNGYLRPEDVARTVLFLVSGANSHITGQVLYVDGGAEATLRGPEVF